MTTTPVTLVTGAGSGIGAATAQLLAARGHRVAALGRRHTAVGEVVAGLDGGGHHAVACDVTDPRAVTEAIDDVVSQLGAPTGLINAAGVCTPAALSDTSFELWSQTLATNLTGSFLVTQAVAAHMRRADVEGSIVNLGSEASSIGMPGYVAYCASKAGVLGMTRSLAAELAPHIRVNALCPGPVDTPMLRAELALTSDPEAAWEEEVARVPLRRIATAAEIADAAVWLLTSRVATATVLPLDGGTTAAFYGAR